MQQRHALATIALFVSLLCSTCSYQDLFDMIVPEEEAAFAQDYLQKLRERDYDHVLQYLDSTASQGVTSEQLSEIADYFPNGELLSVETVGSNVFASKESWQANLTLEYHFTEGWALAAILLQKTDGNLKVMSFQINKTNMSLQEANKFTLVGKSFMHYLVLGLAVAVPIFCLTSLWFCIKTPMARRKWLWIIFILLGFTHTEINWVTGAWTTKALSFQLLGASAFAAGPYAPWIVAVSVPLGAIIFWWRRKTLIAQVIAKPEVNSDTDE